MMKDRVSAAGSESMSDLLVRAPGATDHKPIKTLPISILQIILYLANAVLAVTYSAYFINMIRSWDCSGTNNNGTNNDKIAKNTITNCTVTWYYRFYSPYSVMAYFHVFMWCVLLVLHVVTQRMHRVSLAEGYFTFYRTTKNKRGAPVLIASGMNAFLLVFYTILEDISVKQAEKKGVSFHNDPLLFVLMVFAILEMIAAFIFIFSYMYDVWGFNKARLPPDFHENNTNSSNPAELHENIIGVGFQDVDRAAEIIERQYDIILHLRARLAHLARTATDNSLIGGEPLFSDQHNNAHNY